MAAGDLRLEVWRRPGAAVFERLVEQIPGPFNFTKRMAGGVGQGDMTVPATWDRINNVITRVPGTPSSDVRTLNRVLMEQASGAALVKYEWFNDTTGDESREDFTQIQGAGIESIMADGIVYPWDWDGLDESTSTFPDWIWGGKDVVGPLLTTFAPHIFDVWISAGATGTLDIDVDLNGGGFQSASVAPGDSAATVETAVEALTNVIAADVQGNGTEESPWRISITEPAGTWTVAIDSGGLSGGRGFLVIQEYGALLPIGWTPSRVGSTMVGHGVLTDFRASLGGGADPVLPAGCDAWIVFLGQEWFFPGVQKRVRVTAGAPFQIPDDYIQLYAQGANADVRLIVRDMFEQEICSVELSLVSNTLTPVPGFSCLIPPGITEVVFRLGHIGTGTPPRIFMACPSFREGLAPTTAGGIMDALMDDAILDHVADGRLVWENLASPGTSYLVPTFTTVIDSDGVTWDEAELTFTAQRGKTYLQVLTDLNHLGYKWTVTAGAIGSWNLNLYNPDWVDTDATALSTPAINIGSGVTGGPIFRSHMTGNVITVEGSQMQFGRSASATSVTSIGRREAYQPDRSLLNNQMASLRAAEEVASRLLSGLSVSVTVDPVNGPIPLLDYDVDWQLNVQIPPILQKSAHRLASITVSVGEITQYKLAFSSESFAGVQGVIEGVRRLMLKFEGLERPTNEDIPVALTGVGGAPTVVIAASDATEYSKQKADWICSGVNDEGVIQRAIDILSAGPDGGTIWLSEGTFHIVISGGASPINLISDNGITLRGLGRTATQLLVTYPSPSGETAVITTSPHSAVRDLTILDDDWSGETMGIQTSSGLGVILDNLAIYTSSTCVSTIGFTTATSCILESDVRCWDGADHDRISDCDMESYDYIEAAMEFGPGVTDFWVDRCYISGGKHHIYMPDPGGAGGSSNRYRITNNWLIGCGYQSIFHNGQSGGFSLSHIRGNLIMGVGGEIETYADTGAIHIIGDATNNGILSSSHATEPASSIIDNVVDGSYLQDGIRLENAHGVRVHSNHVEDSDGHGISLVTTSDADIRNNMIVWQGGADNTFDGVNLSADSNRNKVDGNTVINDSEALAPDWRYAYNIVSGTNNILHGNTSVAGKAWGTGEINDTATGTVVAVNFGI